MPRRKKIDLENEQRRRAEGDAKGWNTTAKAEERAKQRVEIVKRLEEIAVKRGDALEYRDDLV